MKKQIEIPEGHQARIEGNKVIIELKENEDERIRKAMIECFKARGQGSFAGYSMPTILAYLEKQKEVDYLGTKISFPAAYSVVSDAGYVIVPKKEYEEYLEEIRTLAYNEGIVDTEKKYEKELKPAEQLGGTFTSYDIAKTFTEGQNYVIAHPEKFGLCKPAEWSEENKEIMHDIIKYHYDQGEISSKHNKWASWLEHKYFSLQSNWKPSENKDVYEIAYERYPINNRLVREVTKDINEDTRDGFIDGYNYCNSTHWKPSKKQMEALKVVARGFLADDPDAIDSLLTDLQKLL